MVRRVSPIEKEFMSRFGDKFIYFAHLKFGVDHMELKAVKKGNLPSNQIWDFVVFTFPLIQDGELINWDSYSVRPFNPQMDW